MISAKQIKAARALLDWGQNELATATSLSVTTIRNLESGEMSVRGATMQIIRQVMESSGIEFTDGEGVRCRNDKIKVFEGLESSDTFLEDMIRTITKNGGNVEIIIPSYNDLLQACGIMAGDNVLPLAEISRIASIRCLLSEMPKPPINLPAFEFRLTTKQSTLPLPCFIYDNHCAFAMLDGVHAKGFVALRMDHGVNSCRRYFHTHWESAQPIYTDTVLVNRRIRTL